MKAVRYHGNRDIRVETIPNPELPAGTLKIAPAYAGICGTDLHEYLHGPSLIPAPGHPDPQTGETLPLTLGHEFSGTVTAVGAGVDAAAWPLGTRVAVEPSHKCGQCEYCARRDGNLCTTWGAVGITGRGGGLAEAVALAPAYLHALPAGVSLRAAALVEPLAVAWHAVAQVPQLHARSKVLVCGAGPIGLALLKVLRAQGIADIVVSEVSPTRKELAGMFGAAAVVDPTAEPLGVGCVDVAFDAAGVGAKGLLQALKAVKRGGVLVTVAIWQRDMEGIKDVMVELTTTDKTLKGSWAYESNDFKHVIEAMGDGRLKPEDLITSVVEMDEVVEKGFKALIDGREGREGCIKILVRVNGGE